MTRWLASLYRFVAARSKPRKSPRPQGSTVRLEAQQLEQRDVPSAASAGLVNSLYQQYLGRGLDSAGSAFWVGQLDAGAPRQEVARQIIHSAEANGQTVQHLHRAMLNRPAVGEGATWAWNTLQGGASAKDLQVLIAASDEFFRDANSDNKTWLNAVYQGFLGRPLDPASQAYWLAQLDSGGSRFNVALSIRRSPEAAVAAVTDAYQQILGYGPDAAGKQYWAQRELDGLSVEDMNAEIAGSGAAANVIAARGGFADVQNGVSVPAQPALPYPSKGTPDILNGQPHTPLPSLPAPGKGGLDVLGGWPVLPGVFDYYPIPSLYFRPTPLPMPTPTPMPRPTPAPQLPAPYNPPPLSNGTWAPPPQTGGTGAAHARTVYFAVVTAPDSSFPYKHVFPNSGWAPGYRTQQEAQQAGASDVRSLLNLGYHNPSYRIVSVAWPTDAYGDLDSNYSVNLA